MEQPIEPPSRRIADFATAGLIVALAVTLSPIGIRLMTGRLDLSPRITVLSLTFAVFLLDLAAAVLSRSRMRVVIFYVLVLSFPLVLLAAIETAAIAFHLADRFAPLEDMSALVNRSGWPAHLMSVGRKVEQDGLQLYRPWRGHEIIINELGLRTALPTPKRSGEWRIAITGGSVAFGWRMRDADTIPVQVFTTMYRTAESTGLPVNNSSDVFDQSAVPYFIDVTHLNEAGNRRLAAWIAEIAMSRIPIDVGSRSSGQRDANSPNP